MQRGEAVGGAGCTSSLLPTSPLLPSSTILLSASPWAGKSVGLSKVSPDPAFPPCQPLLAHLRGLQLNVWQCRPL